MYALDMYFTDLRSPDYGTPCYSTLAQAEERAKLHLRCLPHLRCIGISDHRGIHIRTIQR